ncbi:hypothetical protein CW731_07160 [Polaribacter sp. ALD11]|uniref:hypothetical protein n=1 Tax=Polaribacter sp. ALD11 TaxID=2058137 RepID=UPI000C315A7B|nr:hypothetical protein [Polaribacter sp. ALD11]AUC85080.1 hypothetical protein CW731_07160 [Polaribacter sp. ALD11]
MEKNKQHLEEDTFLKKYVQEIELDKTKADFTSSIMDAILTEEKQSVLKTVPLISKKIWFISFGFVATCLWFLLKGKSTDTVNFPVLDYRFMPKVEIPNLFGNISISSTIMFAVVTFSILVFVQIAYLKNHFNKQFDS